MERITSTSWTVDEAMNFIISGGTVAPGQMNFDQGVPAEVQAVEPEEIEAPEEPTDEVP